MSRLKPSQVRVPCSTSNLGSGFDTLGLALDRYLHAVFEPGGSTLEVRRTGTLTRLNREGVEGDLLVATFTRIIAESGGPAPRGLLKIDSQIPLARGLGSSAAALVAGHDLARGVMGFGSDPKASFRFATDSEGHGDNAAPCAFGGLRAVVPGRQGPRALAMELSPDLGFAYAAPAIDLPTSEGRAALPRLVAHAVAVAELGRLAALLRGLAVADAELIRVGVEDELHVPYRLPLIPGAQNAMGAAYDAGAWAVTISGSGSGLIAITGPDDAADVAEAMRRVLSSGDDDPECLGFVVNPDFEGVARTPPTP